MNRSIFVLATFATLSFVVACGDSSDGSIDSPDFDKAAARFDGNPTGSLTKDNGGSVATGTRKSSSQGKTGMDAQPLGGGSSGTGTKSLRILSNGLRPLAGSSASETCADIEADKETGSCACDSGSMKYEIPNIKAMKSASGFPAEAEVKIKFDSCKIEGKIYEGIFAMKFSKPKKASSSSDETKDKTDKSETDEKDETGGLGEDDEEDTGLPTAPATPMSDFLVVMNMSVDAEKIAMAFAFKQGAFWYSVDVDEKGEYVLVKLGSYTEGNGSYSVLAKNGEYDCNLDDGKGDCKKKGGTERISIDETSGGGKSGDEKADDEKDVDEEDVDLKE